MPLRYNGALFVRALDGTPMEIIGKLSPSKGRHVNVISTDNCSIPGYLQCATVNEGIDDKDPMHTVITTESGAMSFISNETFFRFRGERKDGLFVAVEIQCLGVNLEVDIWDHATQLMHHPATKHFFDHNRSNKSQQSQQGNEKSKALTDEIQKLSRKQP